MRGTASALLLFTVIGCGGGETGPKLYTIKGVVTFAGAPLADGEMTVRAEDGGHAAGAKIVNGAYTLQVTPGKKRVEIIALREIPGEFREDNPGQKVAAREQYIPAKYNAQSELGFEATSDGQEVKLDLVP